MAKVTYKNKLYKIKRLSDGYFSCGRSQVTFTPEGRFFKRGPLLTHLSYLSRNKINTRAYGPSMPKHIHTPEVHLLKQYVGCEIVEYEIKQLDTASISLPEYIFDKLL